MEHIPYTSEARRLEARVHLVFFKHIRILVIGEAVEASGHGGILLSGKI